jgi:hypothetical protein
MRTSFEMPPCYVQMVENILEVVCGRSWSGDQIAMLQLYHCLVLSVIDYGSFVYGSATKCKLSVIDSVHSTAVCLAIGVSYTSHLESLYAASGEPLLSLWWNRLLCGCDLKLVALSHHPSFGAIFYSTLCNRYELHIQPLDLCVCGYLVYFFCVSVFCQLLQQRNICLLQIIRCIEVLSSSVVQTTVDNRAQLWGWIQISILETYFSLKFSQPQLSKMLMNIEFSYLWYSLFVKWSSTFVCVDFGQQPATCGPLVALTTILCSLSHDLGSSQCKKGNNFLLLRRTLI